MPTRYSNCKRIGHSLKEYSIIKCIKCDEKGYVVKYYTSKKINWLEDIIES